MAAPSPPAPAGGLQPLDYIIVGGYLTLVMLVAAGATLWTRIKGLLRGAAARGGGSEAGRSQAGTSPIADPTGAYNWAVKAAPHSPRSSSAAAGQDGPGQGWEGHGGPGQGWEGHGGPGQGWEGHGGPAVATATLPAPSATAAHGSGSASSRGKPLPPPLSDEPEAFFLADRAASWWVVAASYFASNIGTDAIVGLSSAGASVGLAAASFDLASALAFLALAYCFLPAYRASGVYTLPEWAEARFGRSVRLYLAAVSLALYALAKVAVALYCGSLVLAFVTGTSPWAGVGALLVLTAIFSATGGLRAVLAVEVWNTGLLLVGGAAGAAVAVAKAGGMQALLSAIRSGTDPSALAAGMSPSMAHLAQPLGAPYALPALIVGTPWLILWFHCGDQEMVQRGLSGASDAHARLGSVLAGWLKLTVPWTWALPGIAARILFPQELGCPPLPTPAEGGAYGRPTVCTQPNLAYPVLMTRLLPSGLSGALLAACLAGVLSVLASTLNSASTLATMDLVRIAARTMATHPLDREAQARAGEQGQEVDGGAGSSAAGEDDDDGQEVAADDAAGLTAATPAGQDEAGLLHQGAAPLPAVPPPPPEDASAFERVQYNARLVAARAPILARSCWASVRARIAWVEYGRACGGGSGSCCSLPYRPRLAAFLLKPHTLVWTGRLFILVLVCVSVAWLPILPRLAPSLYTAMQSLNAYVAPPVAVVFTAGLLWPGATEQGAIACLAVGHALGAARLILELSGVGEPLPAPEPEPQPPPSSRGKAAVAVAYALLARPDFLYFAAASGAVSVVTLVLASLRSGKGKRLPLSHVGPLSAPFALKAGRAVLLARARISVAMGRHGPGMALRERAERYRRLLEALADRNTACAGCGRRLRVEVGPDAAGTSASIPSGIDGRPLPGVPGAEGTYESEALSDNADTQAMAINIDVGAGSGPITATARRSSRGSRRARSRTDSAAAPEAESHEEGAGHRSVSEVLVRSPGGTLVAILGEDVPLDTVSASHTHAVAGSGRAQARYRDASPPRSAQQQSGPAPFQDVSLWSRDDSTGYEQGRARGRSRTGTGGDARHGTLAGAAAAVAIPPAGSSTGSGSSSSGGASRDEEWRAPEPAQDQQQGIGAGSRQGAGQASAEAASGSANASAAGSGGAETDPIALLPQQGEPACSDPENCPHSACAASAHCAAAARKEAVMNRVADGAAVGLVVAVAAIIVAVW